MNETKTNIGEELQHAGKWLNVIRRINICFGYLGLIPITVLGIILRLNNYGIGQPNFFMANNEFFSSVWPTMLIVTLPPIAIMVYIVFIISEISYARKRIIRHLFFLQMGNLGITSYSPLPSNWIFLRKYLS